MALKNAGETYEEFYNDSHSVLARYKLRRKVERGSRLYKGFPSFIAWIERLARATQFPWESRYDRLIDQIGAIRMEERVKGNFEIADKLRDILQNNGLTVNDKSPK